MAVPLVTDGNGGGWVNGGRCVLWLCVAPMTARGSGPTAADMGAGDTDALVDSAPWGPTGMAAGVVGGDDEWEAI